MPTINTSTKVNIVIEQETDFTAYIDLVDANGAPKDFSNYIANTTVAKLKKHYLSSNSIDLSVSYGSSNGTLTVTLDDQLTSNIESGKYVYSIKVRDSSNNFIRLVEGLAIITPEVS